MFAFRMYSRQLHGKYLATCWCLLFFRLRQPKTFFLIGIAEMTTMEIFLYCMKH